MWSRYHWLAGWVYVRGGDGKRVFVPVPPLALFAVRSALLSADGLLGLIPGGIGRIARNGADGIQRMLAVLLDEGFQADVKVKASDADVRVNFRMV